jgi:hypothetical protein
MRGALGGAIVTEKPNVKWDDGALGRGGEWAGVCWPSGGRARGVGEGSSRCCSPAGRRLASPDAAADATRPRPPPAPPPLQSPASRAPRRRSRRRSSCPSSSRSSSRASGSPGAASSCMGPRARASPSWPRCGAGSGGGGARAGPIVEAPGLAERPPHQGAARGVGVQARAPTPPATVQNQPRGPSNSGRGHRGRQHLLFHQQQRPRQQVARREREAGDAAVQPGAGKHPLHHLHRRGGGG